ncbi:hypothetical protein [Actinokineospora sp. UTMC 2448]|uniref:hypothetical protein n=1 Tax=Actinokineospora sp. UTMC 2448 TaxID=2268449 RepID=UPI0021645786|nr:hypothetical protein [Actinokineospora sp. UTMC 2448]UVS77507.1 hypothetical protein Actkin_01218 [Actinokineospora sp. UTMC 2448]
MINYDGRRFRKPESPDAPVSTYRQKDDLVWAEFGAGGSIRRGSLTGLCSAEGVVSFAYTMVMTDGRVISGHSVNTPEYLPDGRIRLNEVWERYGPNAERGVSAIVEVVD